MLQKVEGKREEGLGDAREFRLHLLNSPPPWGPLNAEGWRSDWCWPEAPAPPRPVGLLPSSFSGCGEQSRLRVLGVSGNQPRLPARRGGSPQPCGSSRVTAPATAGLQKTSVGLGASSPSAGSRAGGRAPPGPRAPRHPRSSPKGATAQHHGPGAGSPPARRAGSGAAGGGGTAGLCPPQALALPEETPRWGCRATRAPLQLCPALQPGGAQLASFPEAAPR